MHQERHHRPQKLPIHQLTLSGCLNRTLIPSSNLQSILSDWGGTGIIFVLVTQNIGGGGGGHMPPVPPQFLHLCTYDENM